MLKAWSPEQQCQRGLCEGLAHEGSELISGLTQGWTNNSVAFWAVVETVGAGLAHRSGPQGKSLGT